MPFSLASSALNATDIACVSIASGDNRTVDSKTNEVGMNAHRLESKGATAAYWVGRRVQIPAYTDRWMMGDRYGRVTLAGTIAGRDMLRVDTDHGGKVRVWADDCVVTP